MNPRTSLLAAILTLAGVAGGCQSDRTIVSGDLQDPAITDALVYDPAPDPAVAALEWPRIFQEGALTFSVYQPQIDRWDGLRLESRAAVAVKSTAGDETYGVIEISGTTDVDKVARTVTLSNLNITKATFPSAPNREMAYLALLRNHVPAVRVLSLDHFEASYSMSQTVQNTRIVEVNNSVPRIIFSTTPSLLILVDGSPVLRAVPQSAATQVINTRALVLKINDKFYATAVDRWYEATNIEGPWTLSAAAPVAALAQARMNLLNAKQPIDLLQPVSVGTVPTPPATPLALYVSTVPTELIQAKGKPEYEPIQGTQLLQVKNSDNAIFLDISSNQFFVLISGRWFKGPSLERGPWFYVPGRALPGDFAKIPPDHVRANVLVSVPGTPEAQEAVIANSIPQTAEVNRNQTTTDVTYDGEPQFVPVQSVPALEYAVNTPTPVVHVIGSGFYCVQNGVWFQASAAHGPWVVADVIPPVIYAIPASCPLHYVTYVRVYDSTPEVVFEGYTPGYLGTVVSPDYVVVYGTGYYYPPYVGTTWIGSQWTYGYGAGFADGFDVGFEFGFSAGVDFGIWPEVWWGPVGWGWRHGYHYHHHALNQISIYNHWSRHGVTSRGGPRGTEPVRHGPFNPYGAQRPQGQPGHRLDTALHTQGSQHPSTPVAPRSNIYAGHDGQVYRNNGTEWQQHTSEGWQSAERDRNFQAQRDQIERERNSRNLGQQRFEANHPSARPAPSAGAGHGGGHR